MGIKHSFTSSKAVGADATKVRSNDWNDDHDITGDVDFSGFAITNIEDDAYNATSWDGNLDVPTKNALRDKIEALVLGSGSGTLITPRSSTLTIASGAITVTASFHYVNTEGSAAFDTLDTINGGTDGQRVVLAAANAARRVNLSDGVGNLVFGQGGFTLGAADGNFQTIELIYDANLSQWREVSRFGGRAYAGVKNVKDYGAVGDNTHDDTANIQAAIDDLDAGFNGIYQSNLTLGTILFPAGTYKVTSAISVLGNPSFRFLGEANAVVTGNFNGFIFDVSGGFDYAAHSFEHLRIVNNNTTNTTSGCIHFNGTITGAVRSCMITCVGGIGVFQDSAQDVTVDCCAFKGDGIGGAGGIGFCSNNAGAAINCDFTSWSEAAIRHQGLGLSVIGGRMEVNENGIQLGLDESGGNNSASAVHISGVSMESNNIHIDIQTANGVAISGVGGQSFNAGNTHGLRVRNGQNVSVESSGFSGGAYSVGAIVATMTTDTHIENITFRNCTASSWVLDADIDTTNWVNTDHDPAFTNRYSYIGDDTGIPPSSVVLALQDTIASGAITVEGNYMVIDTEGAAATDDLTTISGAVAGQHGSRLVLRAASSARTVVVKDGTGNIHCAGDFNLDNIKDTITLIFDRDEGWLELCRSDNGA